MFDCSDDVWKLLCLCPYSKVRPNTHRTASSVATGVSSAFVDLDLTAGPSEAGPAGTGVAALTSVATSGSIHAGLVVSAVVEIWKDTAAHVDYGTTHGRTTAAAATECLFVLRHTRLFLFFQWFFFAVHLQTTAALLLFLHHTADACCYCDDLFCPSHICLFTDFKTLLQFSMMKDRRDDIQKLDLEVTLSTFYPLSLSRC